MNEDSLVCNTDSAEEPDWNISVASIPQENILVRLFTTFKSVMENLVEVIYSTSTSRVLERLGTV